MREGRGGREHSAQLSASSARCSYGGQVSQLLGSVIFLHFSLPTTKRFSPNLGLIECSLFVVNNTMDKEMMLMLSVVLLLRSVDGAVDQERQQVTVAQCRAQCLTKVCFQMFLQQQCFLLLS